jgi:hypothetical protein
MRELEEGNYGEIRKVLLMMKGIFIISFLNIIMTRL